MLILFWLVSQCHFPSLVVLQLIAQKNSLNFWRGFVWGVDLLKIGIRKEIGNGSSINVFSDLWLPRPMLFQLLIPNFGNYDVMADSSLDANGQWDEVLVKNLFFSDAFQGDLEYSVGRDQGSGLMGVAL